jgi:hypothetical protein
LVAFWQWLFLLTLYRRHPPPQKFFLKKIKKKWSAAATNKIDTLDVDSLKIDFF